MKLATIIYSTRLSDGQQIKTSYHVCVFVHLNGVWRHIRLQLLRSRQSCESNTWKATTTYFSILGAPTFVQQLNNIYKPFYTAIQTITILLYFNYQYLPIKLLESCVFFIFYSSSIVIYVSFYLNYLVIDQYSTLIINNHMLGGISIHTIAKYYVLLNTFPDLYISQMFFLI